ncbi:MAG: DUF4976 domain-containing protein, partial [Planctomycetota bacterium]|nr:DUF4976 domain-containing protein [Planctomycetota bacterium]
DNGVFKRTPQRAELYDLVADPGELVNLAGEPAYAGIEAQLRERLVRWLAETDGSP